jgi:hypothetical protein
MWGPARWGPVRCGPIRGRPQDRGKCLKFPAKTVALGLALTIVALLARPAPASPMTPIDSFSGIFTTATATTAPNTLVFPANSTAINDPTGDLAGATVNTLTTTLGIGEESLSALSLTYTSGSDTYEINFTLNDVTITPETFTFTPFTLYYGLITAVVPINGVTVTQETGTLNPALTAQLETDVGNFTTYGGNFGLTYNGILVVPGVLVPGLATIEAAPSASFTLSSETPAPEPTTAILTLTGAAALALERLARQLRSGFSTEMDAPSDS